MRGAPPVIVAARGHDHTRDQETDDGIVGVDPRRAGRGKLVAPDHVLSGVSRTMLRH